MKWFISDEIPYNTSKHHHELIIEYVNINYFTIFSFFSGMPLALRVEVWFLAPAAGCRTPDLGRPDVGGGGLARPFWGILGRDGVLFAGPLLQKKVNVVSWYHNYIYRN